uniref:Uncharacterized protein n=1 Tax=Setaria italica TaxID=4555 RepID=K3Y1T3_SETIT
MGGHTNRCSIRRTTGGRTNDCSIKAGGLARRPSTTCSSIITITTCGPSRGATTTRCEPARGATTTICGLAKGATTTIGGPAISALSHTGLREGRIRYCSKMAHKQQSSQDNRQRKTFDNRIYWIVLKNLSTEKSLLPDRTIAGIPKNVVHVVKENAEYLDPYAICEVRHNFSSQQRRTKGRNKYDNIKSYEEGSAYIAFMTLKWKDRHYIWAPCNFQAYQHCITDGGIHNPERPKEMVVRTNFPCHKKPSGSVHYEYYVCEHIRMLGRYTTDPERTRPRLHSSRLHEQQLLNIGVDL